MKKLVPMNIRSKHVWVAPVVHEENSQRWVHEGKEDSLADIMGELSLAQWL